MKPFKKYIVYLIPPIIVAAILLVLFFIENVYPFSQNTVIQVDADYQAVPMLYGVWDAFHAGKNIAFDINIGGGLNIYERMVFLANIFSPLNLTIALSERESIAQFWDILIIIKMSLIAFTSFIFIRDAYKNVKLPYQIIGSVLYAFSGWVILNYFNFFWLDCVILFPLIMYYLKKLLLEEKCLGYIITLALSIIISYYISVFIIIFILFSSLLVIFLYVPKKKATRAMLKLGFSTIIAIGISMFSFLPTFMQTVFSARWGDNYDVTLFACTYNKIIYILFYSLPIILFGKMLTRFKEDKKGVLLYSILLLLVSIGVIFEPINLVWHGGSHWSFPYRYAFLANFVFIAGGMHYLNNVEQDSKKNCNILTIIFIVLLGGVAWYTNKYYSPSIISEQITLDFDSKEIFFKILLIVFIFFAMMQTAIKLENKYVRGIMISLICLMEIFVYTKWCMHYESGYFLTKNVNQIYEEIELDNNNLDRYKIYVRSICTKLFFYFGCANI